MIAMFRSHLIIMSSVECFQTSQYNLNIFSLIFNFPGGHGVFNLVKYQGIYPNIFMNHLVGLSCNLATLGHFWFYIKYNNLRLPTYHYQS